MSIANISVLGDPKRKRESLHHVTFERFKKQKNHADSAGSAVLLVFETFKNINS